jgi:transcription-repair coupling factor (superfamily II helicase)
MKLNGLLEYAEHLPEIGGFLSTLAEGGPLREPLGVYHAARPYLAAIMAHAMRRPLVVVTARSSRARQWVDELRTWLPDAVPVHFFADGDALPYERIPWAPETRQRRVESLVSLLRPESAAPVVVASARALMQKTLPVREMYAALRAVRAGQRFDLNKALSSWVGLGYEAASVVEAPGQFSRRGGIVDIWPPNLRKPLRLELFGDQVDSLRSFDPSTQRTVSRVSQAWVGPASEALPKLGERVAGRLGELDLTPCHPPARVEYERELAQLLAGTGCRNLEWYIPYLYSQPASLLDYLAETWTGPERGGWLVLDEAAEIIGALTDLESQAEQLAKDLTAAGDLPSGLSVPYLSTEHLRERFEQPGPTASSREDSAPQGERYPVIMLGSSTLSGWGTLSAQELASVFVAGPRFGGQIRMAVAEIERAVSRHERVIVASRQTPRLADIFRAESRGLPREAHARIQPVEGVTTVPPPGLTLVQGVMDEGWLLRGSASFEDGSPGTWEGRSSQPFTSTGIEHLPDSDGTQGLWFLTDAELFGWGKPKPRRPLHGRALSPEVFFADVGPGDFVVHMEHGIGQYQGLVRMTLDGTEREYLEVDYAEGDRLYLPAHQADRLARYVGVGDARPSLHRLGTSDWEQVKARARRAVAEIADDLLELYAAREVVQGHAFSADVAWQAELEASFPYMETEDQLVAVEAVKHDMEQARPMDRLICGDVGYGKTEVALRAAFKAIMDGKQVAILVPTTVLAQQHYTNFSRRLAAFPVNVAMLSRFQTPAQQDRTVAGLANGTVDLVVGTHRLLSNDVSFKDLGLLIVDEEQRFGVTHKERIKQMRTEVDVLTLTATPIPRTLHMSLTGVRDLSTIETPPEDRLPVKSFVGDFDENLIRQAILREMDRNGQVYFVHNRVQGIEQMTARVGKIVPEARVAIAHGQMHERDLSSVMLAFAEGEYDVLVCTSIIESGLDIPNANTIIINRADQFGLAQLYQLRGRVGRSAVRAYAYLLVDRYKTLTEDARRRLEAIQEASELGAGFRIAMQDLEIRGAGELLGARQHGHIAAVGFDLYIRLLAQAVQEARERFSDATPRAPGAREAAGSSPRESGPFPGLERAIPPAVTLDLNLPARIPDTYVPEPALRLKLYRRLASLTEIQAVEDVAQELADRFGPIPEEVRNLLYIVRVKVRAINAGVEAISQEEGQLLIKCSALETLDRPALHERLKAQGVPARIARRGIWMELREEDLWQADLLRTLETIQEGASAA